MNAERLLAYYEKIADAPDAIARLRRFVLDLAVRGKLLPQDTKDEPALELLKRIAMEKARLIKAGEIRKEKPPQLIADDELPFELPSGWRWTRLGTLIHLVSGQHLQPPEYSEDPKAGLPYITGPSDFGPDGLQISRFALARKAVAKQGQLLLTVKGSGVGKATTCDIPEVAISRQLMALTAIAWSTRFLVLVTHRLAETLQANARSLIPGISREDVEEFVFALPPLAEQQRIVAKVDELMALCDRLEAARGSREAARDRVVAATLARLNAPDPETFQADARFTLDTLAALTTRPDQIKALRQTILNLAVRGKLVVQNAGDESASELLKRLAQEKTRLVKEGKSKRQEALPEVALNQAPFKLPVGWAWARFPEVGTFGRGKSKHRPRNDPALFDGGEHLMVQTGDVARSQGVIETYTSKYNDFGLSQSFKWPKGTLCITIAANIADSGILSFDACFPDSVVGFIPASMFANARYFEYFVRTAKANLLEFAPATAQKNINLEILTQVLIPLPPLAEQQRIVAKVDALMALCGGLEASLAATAAARRRLLDALLAEALAPAEDRELEAAE